MKKVYKIGAVITTLCVIGITIFTLTKNESINPETVTQNQTVVSAAETKGSPQNIKDISKRRIKTKNTISRRVYCVLLSTNLSLL